LIFIVFINYDLTLSHTHRYVCYIQQGSGYFLGVALGGGVLYLLALVYFWWSGQEGMGGGDIKLLAWIGAMIGYKGLPFVLLVSSLTGLIVGLIRSRSTGTGLKTVIPFGPFLALAALIYILGGSGLGIEVFSFMYPDL
jgi:leader peptidase (prepilin peptidase)/N-methyltransferase